MKTDELIQTLVADARPVRPLRSPGQRCLYWLGFALLYVAAVAVAWGLRADLGGKVQDAPFLVENGSLLILFFLAARSAFQLSVPGEERPVSTLALPLLGFAFWLCLVFFRQAIESGAGFPEFDAGPGLKCIARILALGMFPAGVGYILLRRAAPQKWGWSGFFLSLSALALAALGTQALCVNDFPQHVFFWHFLPVLVLGFCGALAGSILSRKRGSFPQAEAPSKGLNHA